MALHNWVQTPQLRKDNYIVQLGIHDTMQDLDFHLAPLSITRFKSTGEVQLHWGKKGDTGYN